MFACTAVQEIACSVYPQCYSRVHFQYGELVEARKFKLRVCILKMAEPENFYYNQGHHYGQQSTTRDDYMAFAQANANYCYQLSLWWWNVYNGYNQSRGSQLSDQNCECAERSVTVRCDCDYWQDENQSDPRLQKENSCKDCPGHQMSSSFSSHCPSKSGSSHFPWCPCDEIFTGIDNDKYGADNNTYEDCEEDDDDVVDNGDDDDDDDDDDDNNHYEDDVDEHIYSNNEDNYYASDNSGSDGNDSDTNMEVDDNFRKFLEQSERHRQEREQSKFC